MKKVNLQEVPNQILTHYADQFTPSSPVQIVTNHGHQFISSSPTKSSSNDDDSDQEQKSFIEHSAKLYYGSGERWSLTQN